MNLIKIIGKINRGFEFSPLLYLFQGFLVKLFSFKMVKLVSPKFELIFKHVKRLFKALFTALFKYFWNLRKKCLFLHLFWPIWKYAHITDKKNHNVFTSKEEFLILPKYVKNTAPGPTPFYNCFSFKYSTTTNFFWLLHSWQYVCKKPWSVKRSERLLVSRETAATPHTKLISSLIPSGCVQCYSRATE